LIFLEGAALPIVSMRTAAVLPAGWSPSRMAMDEERPAVVPALATLLVYTVLAAVGILGIRAGRLRGGPSRMRAPRL